MDHLLPGDPVPNFTTVSSSSPKFGFEHSAGRNVVVCFFGSAAHPDVQAMLAQFAENHNELDDSHASFFGVSSDPADREHARVEPRIPGVRYFWDFDGQVHEAFGVVRSAPDENIYPISFVLDANLRIVSVVHSANCRTHAQAVLKIVRNLPRWGTAEESSAITAPVAPVLVVPRVFEPAFCRHLISVYDAHGGGRSGFMRNDEDGKTIGAFDDRVKQRLDYLIDDGDLRAQIRSRLSRRLIPEIEKAFQFKVTRIERYIVACYDERSGGHFRPHRDNTTKATAHRKFAVSLNLNAEDFEGCDLRFPEYDCKTYRAPTGGAVVFSCSMLHEATNIKKGRRYVFLPFLYDDPAAELRRENAEYLVGDPPLEIAS